MRDMEGILSEYLPLQVISYGDVYAPDEDPDAWLNEYDFYWKPIVEGHAPQLYLSEKTMRFGPESERDKKQAIKNQLNGADLRLPKISNCWGDGSIMFSNTLADKLSFSPILGVTKTAATIVDAAGVERKGFTAFSFHKIFFHQRITTRLATLPAEQRPIIRVLLKGNRDTYFVHKAVLEQWQKLGVEDVLYDIDEKFQSFQSLCNEEFYFGSGGSRCFKSLAEFQSNQSGDVWNG